MKDFIDQHRDTFGVEPICKVLQIARPVTAATPRRNAIPHCAVNALSAMKL